MSFEGEQSIQENENKIQGQEIEKDEENTNELRQRIIEKKKEEREKLEQYGKIGQKVRIKNRPEEFRPSDNGLVGEIIAVETKYPFSDEILNKWVEEEEEGKEPLPGSLVKIYITEGEKRGQVVDHLFFSEWEPVETE